MSTGDAKRILLHICCGPDATVPWPELALEGFDVTGFFYGGNIHPAGEYTRRLEAVEAVARSNSGNLAPCRYLTDPWFEAVRGLEGEPEGGRRCSVCFRVQLKAAAEAASELGIDRLTTTLTISPHKDPELINSIGREEADRLGLLWEDRVWRKRDGFLRSVRESRRLGVYRQNYCGCIYSMRNRDE
ncbi:epoxyqueuosine reductase QueH [Dethiosulfovibrio sp. F2B]|uniref:epoxyqueuosine reductase QueH n=1 Tax=Dethiosulfovibrio faecalis TaxID=2720018 RepID=UPI001F16B8FB|nr:epoxyqueuosine reductase QueH [Dethiosulfovibrio faecalis]MCF4150819.1 epoxyqueuosine reductase QueH [Dethiosulfovibrio faecalis]